MRCGFSRWLKMLTHSKGPLWVSGRTVQGTVTGAQTFMQLATQFMFTEMLREVKPVCHCRNPRLPFRWEYFSDKLRLKSHRML